MGITILEWSDTIQLDTLGLWLKDRAGRSQLSSNIRQLMNRPPSLVQRPTPPGLQGYADTYGEQVTSDVVADIDKYFVYRAGLGFTIGGLGTGLSPLAILPSDVRPSNTAIATLGEGLVGWYMESKGFVPLSRPIGEGPDFVFEDQQSSSGRLTLVEVKSTQQSDIRQQVRDAAIPRLDYTLKVAVSGGSYTCIVAGVIIRSTTDFDILSLEIALS